MPQKRILIVASLLLLLTTAVGIGAQSDGAEDVIPIASTPTSMSNVTDRPVPTATQSKSLGSEIEEAIPSAPTSLSNVINRHVPTWQPTSLSNVWDQFIPVTPTSLSNVQDVIIPTEPTSRSQVNDRPVPRPEATSASAVEDVNVPRTTDETAMPDPTTTPELGSDATSSATTSADTGADTGADADTTATSATASSSEATATEQGAAAAGVSSDLTPMSPSLLDYEVSVLNPQGEIAEASSNLFWILLLIGIPVYAYIIGLVLYTVFVRNKRDAPEDPQQEREDSPTTMRYVLLNSVAMPTGILVIVLALTLFVINITAPSARETNLTIEVHGEQWWWDVHYPEYDIVTANEIQIPAGEPVRIELRSDNVIHSFWVPELSGKMDVVPGAENSMWIQAHEPGVYRGKCAEFCGTQHANMQLLVVALAPDEFEQWVTQQQQDAPVPENDALANGQDVFVGTGCAGCHAIRGLDAAPGGVGPDLTHLASRRTIAAGILPNTRGHLGGWITNPQSIKPGSEMPNQQLTGEDLQALLDYLQSLH